MRFTRLINTKLLIAFLCILFYICIGGITFIANDAQAFLLFNILLVAFIPLIIVVYKLRIVSLVGFFFLCLLAHLVAPVFFFLNKEGYTYKGWSAIWDFDFAIITYLKYFSWVYLFLIFIIFFTGFLTNFFLKVKPWERFSKNEELQLKKQGNNLWSLILVLFLIIQSIIGFWMFKNGVGMTGIKAPELPFKLSGVLYYYSRFIVPLLLYFFLRKSKRNSFILLLVTLFAFWAGITSLSKTGVALNIIPVIFYTVNDKKFLSAGVAVLLFLIGINMVIVARGFLYVVEDGSVFLNDDYSPELFKDISRIALENVDAYEITNMVLQRIGGNQDLVVAFHYISKHPGKGMSLFRQYILLLNESAGNNTKFIRDLIGVDVPKGFAYGLGFTARTIAISELKIWRLLLLAFIASLQLTLNEILLSRAIRRIKQPEFVVFLALIFNLIFFVLVQSQRVYGYLIILSILLYLLKVKEIKNFTNKLISS